MAQFKVGDKVRVKTEEPFHEKLTEGTGIIKKDDNGEFRYQIQVREANRLVWFKESEVFPTDTTNAAVTTTTLTITATLTTDTIPTELIKQLSAAGFLITIKAV